MIEYIFCLCLFEIISHVQVWFAGIQWLGCYMQHTLIVSVGLSLHARSCYKKCTCEVVCQRLREDCFDLFK